MNAVALPSDTILRAAEFAVEGMTCASCAGRIERALHKVPGVVDAVVNLATERASVVVSAEVEDAALHAAVIDAGYVPRIDAAIEEETPSATPRLSRESWHLIIAALLTLPLLA